MKHVRVFVNRQELTGYTNLRLKRTKKDMTGELSIDVFMGWLPTEAVMEDVQTEKEILVYIGEHLAFTGTIDRRMDKSGKKKSTQSTSIGPDSYSVTFTSRGKTKFLVDSSQQHPTGTILAPTNQQVIETLVAPWDIEVEWLADVVSLNRVRFRDGAHVIDEIQRIAEQCSLYIFETREGKLKVLDKAETTTGEAIVLNTNILSFTTDQATDLARSQVLVKGQLTSKDKWGVDAVIPTFKSVADATVQAFKPITVQLYGDATPDLIDRRAQYEQNKRLAEAKQVKVEMFHVLQTDGSPWDIGNIHYVEIPPAGVLGELEIIELEYVVANNKTLKTKLTLAPKPVTMLTSDDDATPLATLPEVATTDSVGNGRAQKFGVGDIRNSWLSPQLSPAVASVTESLNELLDEVPDIGTLKTPPLKLPSNAGET